MATASFSGEELTALARLLGSQWFPGIPDSAAGGRAAGAAQGVAIRGLVARGVVGRLSGGTWTVTPPYEELVATPLTAALVVSVEQRERVTSVTRHLYAHPDRAVEHSTASDGAHRLERLETRSLAARVVELVGLAPREAVDAPPLEVPAGTFAALRAAIRSGDFTEAREALGADGAAFAASLETFRTWCRVRVVWRGGGAADIAWVDTAGSLWRIRPDGAHPQQSAVVEPVSARELVEEIVARLGRERRA